MTQFRIGKMYRRKAWAKETEHSRYMRHPLNLAECFRAYGLFFTEETDTKDIASELNVHESVIYNSDQWRRKEFPCSTTQS